LNTQKELLQGCELIATGVLVICNDDTGCIRAARHFAKQAARAVITTTCELVKVFATHHEHDTENIAAQKTGAVWSTCDALRKTPQGNRNAIRRELFTFVMECNETIQEFTELVELGAAPSSLNTIAEDTIAGSNNSTDAEEGTTWDDFCQGSDEQYSASELPIATASLWLVKCSRGTINVALKACESVGGMVETDGSDPDKDALLEWIRTMTNLARVVGEGMTDLGTCLYPPLDLSHTSDEDDLPVYLLKQRDALVALTEYVLDAPTDLPEEVTELASKLKGAATTRYDEAQAAIVAAMEAPK